MPRTKKHAYFPIESVNIRAVSVNALIYAINAAAINAIKYFNAVNATLKKKEKIIYIFFFYFSLVRAV